MQDIKSETREKLLQLAREAIEEKLDLRKAEKIYLDDPLVNEKRGVFVTLKKGKELRGCIGTVEGVKPLKETICEMAQAAAFSDPRFLPLTKEELPEIKIEISVLTEPREIKNPDQIRLGIDGVIVSSGFNRGIFLPQVAIERGWNLEEFMNQLCAHKAGLEIHAWKKGKVKIETFQVESFSM